METKMKNAVKARRLRLEPLEERQLLAVSPADFTQLATSPNVYGPASLAETVSCNSESVDLSALKDAGGYTADDGNEMETHSIIVTTLDDVVDEYDGQISLREAILYAGTNGLGTTITFAENLSGGTILLNGEQLEITKDLIITAANLENGITINADQKSRVFYVSGDINVSLVGLTMTGGSAGNGGGIYVKNAVLSLMDGEVIGNKSTGAAHSTSGGGGIYSDGGSLMIDSTLIANNTSTSYGAGIYQLGGELTVADNTRFENNTSTSPLITKGNNIHSMSVNAKTHVSEKRKVFQCHF